jgi:hypothetical protein
MRSIKTLRDALDTIKRGCVVDAVENRVPHRVVEALRDKALARAEGYLTHVRYEGSREVWWFCQ